jgi:hypothetical protein
MSSGLAALSGSAMGPAWPAGLGLEMVTICVDGVNTGGNNPGGVKQLWLRSGTLMVQHHGLAN